ncbi:hypothetical protein A7982_12840 [Minicystis rosea]|nr:hypothetical protein A7982_12840 [Minicystis rosea]
MARAMTRWSVGAGLSGLALFSGAATMTEACVRHADIYDEPDGGGLMTTPQFDAGKVMPVDAGLRGEGGIACEDRLIAKECKGPIDFACDFDGFVFLAANKCQKATGCMTNGILEVKMASDGCVSEIGMSQPNDAMVACLVEIFEAGRCPCGTSELSLSLGHDNAGCGDGG